MERRGTQRVFAMGALLATLCGRIGVAAESGPDQKHEAVALLKALQTGDANAVAVIDPSQYTQHNLSVADGLAGFTAMLKQLPPGAVSVNTVRAFQDGEFVFTHTDYHSKIGFDVFRFKSGKIVEHWDNLQDVATHPNPSGRSMIDGPTQASDLTKTRANKAVVRAFGDQVLSKRRYDKVPMYVDAKNYLQHIPNVGDGADTMVAAFRQLDATDTPHRYTKIHRVLGEGDFVLMASEGTVGTTATAFYDLFRVKNGRIVEHWDVLEAIPPKAEWKNANGKF